jgi:hypothetical protein
MYLYFMNVSNCIMHLYFVAAFYTSMLCCCLFYVDALLLPFLCQCFVAAFYINK